MKKIAIMQPYFLPYIGYWQLINAVDEFVVYDNIEYTKKGWINRNRYLQNGHDRIFTVPLKKDSDFLNVKDRKLTADFNRQKLINQLISAYSKAPFVKETLPLIEEIINFGNDNLFEYIFNSIKLTCGFLDIKTKLTVSSTINVDHSLKAEKKVLAICKALKATTYVNAIGGVELYDKNDFKSNNIELKFLKSNLVEYKQFDNDYVPRLSIVDIIMFNSKDNTKQMLQEYEQI